MARVRNYGDLDWVMDPRGGLIISDKGKVTRSGVMMDTTNVMDELVGPGVAANTIAATIFAGIRKSEDGSFLRLELQLDHGILRPAEEFQEEVADYKPQGFDFAYTLGDDKDDENDDEGADTYIGENQLRLPSPLRSSLGRLAIEWNVRIDYIWRQPNCVQIEIEGYKEKIRYPSKFVAALARKLSRWANSTEASAKRCLSVEEICSCHSHSHDPIACNQIESHLESCTRCSSYYSIMNEDFDAIDAAIDEIPHEGYEPKWSEIAAKVLAEHPAPPRQSFARRWWNERLEALVALKKRCRRPGRHQGEETQ